MFKYAINLLLEFFQGESLVRVWKIDKRNSDLLRFPLRVFLKIFPLKYWALFDKFEATELEVDPCLYIAATEQERLSKLQVIFVHATDHQVDKQDTVLVHPLEVSAVE